MASVPVTLRVSIGDRAEAQARQIDRWWIANRPAARDLFHEEFLACVSLLRSSPDIGQPQRHRKLPGLRRVLLPSTRYHVYYVHNLEQEQVLILAVWSAIRRRKPPLATPRSV